MIDPLTLVTVAGIGLLMWLRHKIENGGGDDDLGGGSPA